jgi:hypothetical protein
VVPASEYRARNGHFLGFAGPRPLKTSVLTGVFLLRRWWMHVVYAL